jgi:DnaK suppressor protein
MPRAKQQDKVQLAEAAPPSKGHANGVARQRPATALTKKAPAAAPPKAKVGHRAARPTAATAKAGRTVAPASTDKAAAATGIAKVAKAAAKTSPASKAPAKTSAAVATPARARVAGVAPASPAKRPGAPAAKTRQVENEALDTRAGTTPSRSRRVPKASAVTPAQVADAAATAPTVGAKAAPAVAAPASTKKVKEPKEARIAEEAKGTKPVKDVKVAKDIKDIKQAKETKERKEKARSSEAVEHTGTRVWDEAYLLFLAHQRELLLAERKNYTRQAEELRAEAEALALEHEPGDVQFDEEGGEGGTANVDRELDLHLSAQAHAAIEEIDAALAKIDVGTYGYCESCGNPIPKARLEALPHARLCVSCKSGGLTARRQ